MGAQEQLCLPAHCTDQLLNSFQKMAPMKAATKAAKAMTKGELADALATANELKKAQCGKIVDSLTAIATKEVKKSGKFVIPGLCMIKTRLKPATKAGKREIFGKMTIVKAKPAKTVVKAFPAGALKKAI